ncbi:hypothetical protein F3K32_35125 [Streptomyces sp. LBUM 1483]|nr:hypothetical protein [Streptomyces sp. LBUM 1483]
MAPADGRRPLPGVVQANSGHRHLPPCAALGEAFAEFQYPTPPLYLQPDAHKAVIGGGERLDVPLTIAA